MKKYSAALFCIFFAQLLYSQNNLSGTLLDRHTKNPVDYVNIGVLDKAKGTVSNNDGSFKIALDASDINSSDTLQISRIGYKTLKFSVADFRNKILKDPIIFMEEAPYELEEITVGQNDIGENRVGYESTSRKLFGFWNDSLALGGEHASKIRIKKGPLKLEDVSFNIVHSISDSLLVRVNVYEIDKGMPAKNISKRNILHTIKKKRGKVVIDLSPYNIKVDEHFIVSLELLKIYGKKVGIAISAFDDGLRSYTRLLSQDTWRRMKKGTAIAFNLNTSPIVNTGEPFAQTKTKLREKPEEVTILWDNSLSMGNRALYKELTFLDAYFKKMVQLRVKFQTFGHTLGEIQEHTVENGNWDTLKERIIEIVYDGATNENVLANLHIGEHTFLFTDGNRFSENVNSKWNGTVFTVNSKLNGNHHLLKSIAEDSDANYINLEKMEDMSLAIDFTNRYLIDNLEYEKIMHASKRLKTVKGNVSDFDDPIHNATVQVIGTDRKTRTDSKGNFNIMAKTGDILQFTYPGRETATSTINNTTVALYIAMPLGVETLDEVVLEKNKKESGQSAPLHKNVTTNFGELDARKTGFGVKQIKGEDLDLASQTIMDAIKGKFPGVEIVMKYPEGIQLIALRESKVYGFYAAWDVDGLIYPPEQPPFHISIFNIKNITIMPGAWASSRYGRMAAGGIIIVRTISQSFEEMEAAKDPLYDQAKLRNNIYKDNAVVLKNTMENMPAYLQDIDKGKTRDEAYQRYLKQRNTYGHLPHFYLDVHSFFGTKWKTEKIANLILSNIEEVFPSEINALKALAFTYEEKKLYNKARSVYKTIYDQQPQLAQSQRDLAHIHMKTGQYNEAWALYGQYVKKVKDSMGDNGIDGIVKNEMLDLLEKHGADMEMDISQYTFNTEKSDITLFVEWNNPNTQFELQFVGPEKHYYNWNNSTEISSKNLSKGHFSYSFDIDDIGKGQWLVNVNYLGNYENIPSYLKFTIKENKTGKETLKALKLQTKNTLYKFMSIIPPNQIVSH